MHCQSTPAAAPFVPRPPLAHPFAFGCPFLNATLALKSLANTKIYENLVESPRSAVPCLHVDPQIGEVYEAARGKGLRGTCCKACPARIFAIVGNCCRRKLPRVEFYIAWQNLLLSALSAIEDTRQVDPSHQELRSLATAHNFASSRYARV